MFEEEKKWKFFTRTPEAWDAMLEAINSAQTSIDIEQYILGSDSVGFKFLDALKTASLRGVKVRLLIDAVGSYTLAHGTYLTKELKNTGVEIKIFNPLVFWHPNRESLWYFRDHRKLMIVDKTLGFTGGICLSEAMRDWRDSHVAIRDEGLLFEMCTSFDVMWNKTYHKFRYYFKKRKAKIFESLLEESHIFRFLSNSPLPGKRYMYRELIKRIRSARHYVYLTTPYLLPDSRLLRALRGASRRGVKIKIIIPEKTDIIVVDRGMSTFFDTLLKARVRLFRFNKVMIHTKTAVVDGTWSTIGSLNLDNLSLRYNFEGNITSLDKEFTFELERQFLEDLKDSTELSYRTWQKRSWIQKLLEMLVWPIRKFL